MCNIISDPDKIEQFRTYTLLKAVSLETIGLQQRGRSASAIARDLLRKDGRKAPSKKVDVFYALRDYMNGKYDRVYEDIPACEKKLNR